MPDEEKMSEEDVRQNLMIFDMKRSQLETAMKQKELLLAQLEEHHRARLTLDSYMGSKKGDELLVPIGAGVFIHAKVEKPKKAIMGIGRELSAEKNAKDCLEALEERVTGLETSKSHISTQTEALQQELAVMEESLNKEYQRIQAEEAQK